LKKYNIYRGLECSNSREIGRDLYNRTVT